MKTKVVYFIRHGETVLNAAGIRQGSEGPLTQKGRDQALAVARKFPKKKGVPQVMLVSPFERTRETAAIIAAELGITDIEYSDLLKERRNPAEIIGKSGKDPAIAHIVDIIDKSFHDDNLRYSDEENFPDLRDRAAALLKYLEMRTEERIVVVTHSIFLRMVIAFMLRRDKLTASEYSKLSHINTIENASLTIATYTTGFWYKPVWQLLTWNDQVQTEDQFVELAD